MMKKFLCTAILAAMVLSLVSGCSLFASGGGDGGDGKSGSSGPVKMTESYSFEDPADLDFDTRYVLYCDTSSQMLANVPAEYGILASYSIAYAKDDSPLGNYDFYVCDSAEHAQATIDMYASQGMSLTAAESDPCVVYAVTDADTVEANLVTFQSYGMINDAKVSAYMEFMQSSTGGTLTQ